MKRCLNEKELVTVHARDGSNEARIHLESCLSCARKYRDLQGDMEMLVAALRQPRPNSVRPRVSGATIPWPRGLGWSLAASAMVAAFVCGRVTGFSTSGTVIHPSFTPAVASDPSSPEMPATQVAMTDSEDSEAPAAYGLYINNLMGSDAGDQGQVASDGQDTDDQADVDVGGF
jgi:hypothetical protein